MGHVGDTGLTPLFLMGLGRETIGLFDQFDIRLGMILFNGSDDIFDARHDVLLFAGKHLFFLHKSLNLRQLYSCL